MNVLLSSLPIIVLLVCLLALKWPITKAASLSFVVAFVLSMTVFKPGILGMSIILAKGYSLALFVTLIIWGAMLLYHLISETGALEVISISFQNNVNKEFNQYLLLCWIFSAFLQGVAGFGVPVMIITPMLLNLGVEPLKAVCGVLIGHSWAISFGSMGSSIYAISLVTKVANNEIVYYMSIYGVIAMLCTGLMVCFVYGGFSCLKKNFTKVILLCIPMGSILIILAKLEIYSIIGISTGLVGSLFAMVVFGRNGSKRSDEKEIITKEGNQGIIVSLLPYILIIAFSITFFILKPTLAIRLSFPAYDTSFGLRIGAEQDFVVFNIFRYPFVIILISIIVSVFVYLRKSTLSIDKIGKITGATIDKCTSISITVAMLLITAVTMIDSGMIDNIASTLVLVTGKAYPLFAPFIGLIGVFVTGSNTNSNILLGSLQETAALSLGMNAAIMCAAQSLGASIGNGIGPTIVSIGANAADMIGRESYIYNLALPPIIITILVLGLINMLILMCLS